MFRSFRRSGVLFVALAGMLGAFSSGASAVTTGSDTTPPTLSVATPIAGETVSGIVPVAGAASDDVRVVKVKYRLDGRGDFVAAEGTTTWSGSIDTRAVPNGPHVIWVRAVDPSGNVTAAGIDVQVDNGAASPSPYAEPVYSGHTAWGIFSEPRGEMGSQDVNGYIESLIGRSFDGQRIYSDMDRPVPSSVDRLVASEGGVIYHNINSWHTNASGEKVCRPWAEVAAGVYDAWWVEQARNIAAFGYPMLLSFTHEPTLDSAQHPKCGTAAEFRAAYDHVVHVFASQGVTNVRWVWTLTASTFNGRRGGPTVWEPSHYDIVGVDGYNRAAKWRSPQLVFQSAEDFARLRGKPLLVGEIGCEERTGDPDAKANWVTRAAAMFESWDDVSAIMWTNAGPYRVDSSPEALAAFTSAGLDPYFGGRPRPMLR